MACVPNKIKTLLMPTTKKPLNLKDVAQILGVSTATVSNAFNRPNQLSARLRERILKECAELGYHGPNLAARSLRRGKSDVIGVVLADSLGYSFSDPVASQFLQGVSEVLATQNKQLLLLSSQLAGKEQSSAESLPDGFIFYGTPAGDCFSRIQLFGKRIVAVDFEPNDDVVTIKMENRQAAKEAAKHAFKHHNGALAVLGLRLIDSNRVCRLTEQDVQELSDEVSHKRLQGYLEAAQEQGVDLPPHMVWHIPVNTIQNAEIAAREILTSQPCPDTVLCMSDVMALTLIRVARSMGISVPAQLQVIGFDDIPESAHSEPPLTTVCQQSIEKGRKAAHLLLETEQANEDTVKTKLMVRGTTR